MEEINIKEILKRFFSKLPILLFVAAITFTSLEMYLYFTKEPLYKSETTILLVNEDSTLNQTEIALNQKLVSTYTQIIKSRRVLEQVLDRLELNYDYPDLSKKISVQSISNTEIIKISVSDKNNYMAMAIANSVADIFKEEIVRIYNIKNISIIDKAITQDNPYNISIVKDSIIYAFIGLFMGIIVVSLILFFDTSIKSTTDIENKLNLPVLGTVPKIKNRDKKRGK